MQYLGPLSTSISGSRLFYVDISNQLDTSETLTSISVTPSDSDVIISGAGILSSDVTTKDGTVLPANKTTSFRASCIANKTALISILIDYVTNQGNTDSTIVKLKIVENII